MLLFDPKDLKKLYIPPPMSHKGQNGKLLIIGGSHLFHAASLWALDIASRLVDMVFYSSVPQNFEIIKQEKFLFRNGIIVEREHIEDYIQEADCILIGPGMVRSDKKHIRSDFSLRSLDEINLVADEGIQTYLLSKYLMHKYPKKRWVIDAGALQMMEASWLLSMSDTILTPHPVEFQRLFGKEASPEYLAEMAKKYHTVILYKSKTDLICSSDRCVMVSGGNAGMTKGGTGDVLAGLVASLACKNDLFLSAASGSYINKKAGERLFRDVGYYFNATDLVHEIPRTMKRLILIS